MEFQVAASGKSGLSGNQDPSNSKTIMTYFFALFPMNRANWLYSFPGLLIDKFSYRIASAGRSSRVNDRALVDAEDDSGRGAGLQAGRGGSNSIYTASRQTEAGARTVSRTDNPAFWRRGLGDSATRSAPRPRCARQNAQHCGEPDEKAPGPELSVRVSLSADDYALECSAANVWTSRCRGIWVVGAGVGQLGLGPGERFSADVAGCIPSGDAAVLGHSQVTEPLVVLVLDPNYGGRAVRSLYLAHPDRSAVQQV